MLDQLGIEPTRQNYETYVLQPVFEYEHWDKVLKSLIESPN